MKGGMSMHAWLIMCSRQGDEQARENIGELIVAILRLFFGN